MAQEKIVQTAGRDQLGTFAPKFAELNDDVLFGEVWSRTDKLGLRDRSLVTITSLISHGNHGQFARIIIFSRRRRTASPARRSQRLSLISVSMQVGRKRGQRSIWQKAYGRKILPVRMPKPLSSVR